MLRLLKALPLTLAIAAVSIVATSCNSNNGTKARFVNAIENTFEYGGALDVEVNGTQQFSNVTFASPGSTYTAIPAGNVTFEGFESPGVTSPVFTDSTTLSGGTQYTEVATGQAGGTGGQVVLLSLSDDNSLPNNGTLNFRVINAAFNASPSTNGSVDIWIERAPYNFSLTQPATIRNLAYQSASGYVNVSYNPAAEGFTVFVNTVGLGDEVGTPLIQPLTISVNGSLSSASVCTLVLVDNPNSNSMSTPILLDDNNC
jgi:hypothetical protein